ncbi:hypothetical protein RB620_04490 [Paenibacillus sp. LHD-117]|uniref:hypothetical protein n=1 Tax=Paenibacillus sp. LHD-117 TaxID=3071412 RepID=UPI0027E1D237|nr:hypothetical protein [Paenibacillus sp. LHD-117]MDQ6418691.1 hypothetical protein [Paenibacillus sp. LHD-117]
MTQLIIDNGGLGKDKHKKLLEYAEHWMLKDSDLVVENFEVRAHAQWLTRAYRNGNSYFMIATGIIYDHYQNFLDLQSGVLKIDENDPEGLCEDDLDYENDVMTFHLPLNVIKILGGDSISWLQDKLQQLQTDTDSFDEVMYDYPDE